MFPNCGDIYSYFRLIISRSLVQFQAGKFFNRNFNNITNGEEIICSFTTNGKKYIQEIEKSDLFFAPKKRTGWVNIYNQPVMACGLIFGSEEEAKQSVNEEDKTYVTTVKIEWEK